MFLVVSLSLNVDYFYRDPEFLFYDGAEYKMNAFSVKPAVFDLFLAVAIGGYLAAMYFIVQVSRTLPVIYNLSC